MDKAFQHDYAKAVSLFVQKVPAEIPVTTQEIDAYFRQCVLYLMSFDEAMKNDPNSGIINQSSYRLISSHIRMKEWLSLTFFSG